MMFWVVLVCIALIASVCEGFHWPASSRLVPRSAVSSVNLAKPVVGEVVNAKLDSINNAASNPLAVFSVKSDGEVYKANLATASLTPEEKKRLQVGSEIKVLVANTKGPILEVKLPTSEANSDKDTEDGLTDDQRAQFRSQFKKLSKNGKTVLISDFFASLEVQSLIESGQLDADMLNEMIDGAGLAADSTIDETEFIGLNQVIHEFCQMTGDNIFSEEEIEEAVQAAEKMTVKDSPWMKSLSANSDQLVDASGSLLTNRGANSKKALPPSRGQEVEEDEELDEKAWMLNERKKEFRELSKDEGKSVLVSDFLAEETMAGLLEEGSLQRSTLDAILTRVKSSATGRLSMNQFVQFRELLDAELEKEFHRQMALQKKNKGSDSDDDDDDGSDDDSEEDLYEDDEDDGDDEGEVGDVGEDSDMEITETDSDSPEMYRGWFEELSRDGGKTATVKAFLDDQEVREILAESGVSEERVRALAREKCKVDMRAGGTMSYEQFVQLNELISDEEPDYSVGGGGAEDDVDEDDEDGDESEWVSDDDDEGDTDDDEEEEKVVPKSRGKTELSSASSTPSSRSAKKSGASGVTNSPSSASAAKKGAKQAVLPAKEDNDLASSDRELFQMLSQDGGKTVSLKRYISCEELQPFLQDGSLDAGTVAMLVVEVEPRVREGRLTFEQFVQLNQLISDHLDDVLEGTDDDDDDDDADSKRVSSSRGTNSRTGDAGTTKSSQKTDQEGDDESEKQVLSTLDRIDNLDRELFNSLSQDGGKTVSAAEYLAQLQEEGVLDDIEVKLFLRQAKTDKNGRMTFEQFTAWNDLISEYSDEEHAEAAGEHRLPEDEVDEEVDTEGDVEVDWSKVFTPVPDDWDENEEDEEVDQDELEALRSGGRSRSGGGGVGFGVGKKIGGVKTKPSSTSGPSSSSSRQNSKVIKSQSKPAPRTSPAVKRKPNAGGGNNARSGNTRGGSSPSPRRNSALFMTSPSASEGGGVVIPTRPLIDVPDYTDGLPGPDLDNGVFESYEDAFDRLAQGGDLIRVSDYMQLPVLQGLLAEGRIDVPTLEQLVQRVGAELGEEGRLNFDQFCLLASDVDEICGYDEGIQTQASQAQEDNSTAAEEEPDVTGNTDEEQEKINSYRELYSDLTTLSGGKRLAAKYLKNWSTVKDLMASGDLTREMLMDQLKKVGSDLNGTLTFNQFYRLCTGLEKAMADKKQAGIEAEGAAKRATADDVGVNAATESTLVDNEASSAAASGAADDDAQSDEEDDQESLDQKVVEDQFQLLLDQAHQTSGNKKRSTTLSVKDFKQWEDVRYLLENKIATESQINALVATVLGSDAVRANKKMKLDQFRKIVVGLDALQENHSLHGNEGFDTFDDDHEPVSVQGSGSHRSSNSVGLSAAASTSTGTCTSRDASVAGVRTAKVKDNQAQLEQAFHQLRGSSPTLPLSNILKWERVASLLSQDLVHVDTLQMIAREITASAEDKKGKKSKSSSSKTKAVEIALTLPQFLAFVRSAEQTARLSSDDDEVEDEPLIYDVVPEDVALEMMRTESFDPKERILQERKMMQDLFKELTGGKGKTLDVNKFINCEEVQEMVEEDLLTVPQIKSVIERVTKTKNLKKLTFEQFFDVYMVLEHQAEQKEHEHDAENFKNQRTSASSTASAMSRAAMEVSEEQHEQEVFDLLKPDVEGRISLKQLRLWDGMQQILGSGLLSEDDLKSIVKRVDVANTKKLNLEQFREVLHEVENQIKLNEISALPAVTDISMEEAMQAVEAMGGSSGKSKDAVDELSSSKFSTAAAAAAAAAADAASSTSAAGFTFPVLPSPHSPGFNDPELNAELKSIYNTLKGPEEWLSLTKFKDTQLVKDAVKEGFVTIGLVDEMIDACTRGSIAFMTFEQFKQLVRMVQKTAADLRYINSNQVKGFDDITDSLDGEDNMGTDSADGIQVIQLNKLSKSVAKALAQQGVNVTEVIQEMKEQEEEELSPEEQRKLDMEMFQSFYPDPKTQTISIKQIRKWHVIEDCVDNDEISDPELQRILIQADPEATKRLNFQQFCFIVRAVEAKIESNAREVEEELESEGDTSIDSPLLQNALPTSSDVSDTRLLPKDSISNTASSTTIRPSTVKTASSAATTTTATLSPASQFVLDRLRMNDKELADFVRSKSMPVHPESGRGFARPTMADIRKEAREQQRTARQEAKQAARMARKLAKEGKDASSLNQQEEEEEEYVPEPTKKPFVPATYAEKLYDSLKGLNAELPMGQFKSWSFIKQHIERGIVTDKQIDDILEKAGHSPGSHSILFKPFSTAILVIYDVIKLWHDTKQQLKREERDNLQEADISVDDEFLPASMNKRKRTSRKQRREIKKMLKRNDMSAVQSVEEEVYIPPPTDDEVMQQIYNELKDPKTNQLTVAKLFEWEEIRELIRSGALSHTNLRTAVDMCGFKDRIVEPAKFGDFLRAVDSFVEIDRLNPMNVHSRVARTSPLLGSATSRSSSLLDRIASPPAGSAIGSNGGGGGSNSIIHGIRYDFDANNADYEEVDEEQEPPETTEQLYQRLCNGNKVLPEKDLRRHMKELQKDGIITKEQIDFCYQQLGIGKETTSKVTLDQFERVQTLLEQFEEEA